MLRSMQAAKSCSEKLKKKTNYIRFKNLNTINYLLIKPCVTLIAFGEKNHLIIEYF